ncbi:MAG: hypothetical protein GTO18_01920 [Anaerolineales bacterium]|nr:hypothetical protein [Anaerolineales bacterium]
MQGIIRSMDQAPEFLSNSKTIDHEELFQPRSESRRGELIAWIAAVVIGILLAILYSQSGQINCFIGLLFAFFLFAGLLMTYSHWVDSRITIRVTPEELDYKSPFRVVNLKWNEVAEVRVIKAGRSYRVIVRGKEAYFAYRVAPKTEDESDPIRMLGLPRGDELTRIICGMAELGEPKEQEDEWVCEKSR